MSERSFEVSILLSAPSLPHAAPLFIIAAKAADNCDLLILGLAILAGMIGVPHGWGANASIEDL